MQASSPPPSAVDAPPPAELAPGFVLARGVCRAMIDLGWAPIAEFAPTRGLRADVFALGPKGEIWIVECKSSAADYRSDRKWRGYLDWCDRFAFAVDESFPLELLPPEEGVLLADAWGAEALRDGPVRPLAAARRKALTLRAARGAATRLRGALDPGAPSLSDC
ncbi:MAG: MmcB family DNA repair protein [Pseudomonadota bacterium]